MRDNGSGAEAVTQSRKGRRDDGNQENLAPAEPITVTTGEKDGIVRFQLSSVMISVA